MGRSNRQTADYFPHYVGEKSRTKFILEKNWENDGYAFWFKLLELLCAADGQYYDCWDKQRNGCCTGKKSCAAAIFIMV